MIFLTVGHKRFLTVNVSLEVVDGHWVNKVTQNGTSSWYDSWGYVLFAFCLDNHLFIARAMGNVQDLLSFGCSG